MKWLLALAIAVAPFAASAETALTSGAELPRRCTPGEFFFQKRQPLAHSFFLCQPDATWVETDPARNGIAVVQRFGAAGDGISDDQTAIQSAADFVKSGGGIVFVPPGLYRHSGTIEFGSGTVLQGAGADSVLMASTFPNSALRFAGSQSCGVKQLGTTSAATVRLYTPPSVAILFEGARNCHVSDVFINGSASAGIMVRSSTDMLIERTAIRNTMADGIHVVDGSQKVTVSRNRAFQTGDDSFAAVAYATTAQTDSVTFDHNVSVMSFTRGVTCIGASNCSITNNRVYNPRAHGIAVAYETAFNTYHPRGATLVHNLVRGVSAPGMNPLLVSSASGVIVKDFRAYDSNPIFLHDSTWVKTSDLAVFNALSLGIAGVGGGNLSIQDSRVTGSGGSGILLNGVRSGDLAQNYVADAFQAGPAVYGAIDVASSDSISGAGNQVFSGTPGIGSLLRIASSTSTTVTANSSTLGPAVQPKIDFGGVVAAGLGMPAVESISPNALFSIFGSGFAPNSTQTAVTSADLTGGHLPSTLAGACVDVGGERAFLLFVSSTQINALAALPATGQQTSVEVIANCGQPNEIRSNLRMLPTAPAAPGFFYWQRESNGHNAVLAFDAVTYAAIGQPREAGAATTAYPGEEIGIYMTGFGITESNFDPGAVPQSPAPVSLPGTVYLNGNHLSAADIRYFGTSTFAGVYQLNFRLPVGTPPGEVRIQVAVNGVLTPPGAYLMSATK